MWQFQWMFSLIPDSLLLWVINILLIAGLAGTIAGFFIKFIPFVNTYRLPVQIAGVIALVAGVYFKGGYANEMAWREKVKEAEEKVAVAEARAKEANAKIDEKGKQKIKVIREKGIVIKQYIDREVTKYDSTCPVPAPVVKAHNAAAKNEELK